MKKNALWVTITLVVISLGIWVLVNFPTDNIKTKKEQALETALESASWKRTRDSLIGKNA